MATTCTTRARVRFLASRWVAQRRRPFWIGPARSSTIRPSRRHQRWPLELQRFLRSEEVSLRFERVRVLKDQRHWRELLGLLEGPAEALASLAAHRRAAPAGVPTSRAMSHTSDGAADRSGAGAFVSATLRAILYHRIGDPSGESRRWQPDLVSATPAEFERQIAELATRYTPVGADEVVAAVTERRAPPSGAVLVTFDDGYRTSPRSPGRSSRNTAFRPSCSSRRPIQTRRAGCSGGTRSGKASAGPTARQRRGAGLPHFPLTTLAERRAASAQLAAWLKRWHRPSARPASARSSPI